jgi:hypothetical protein
MKNSSSFVGKLAAGGLALVLGLVAGFTPSGLAQDKGATKLLQTKSARTTATAAPRACAQCKDTIVTITERSVKTGAKPDSYTTVRHECPGCKTTQVSTGHGRAKATTPQHACQFSGGRSGACCAGN